MLPESTREKSVLLAKAVKWKIHHRDVGIVFRPDLNERWIANLYDPANMALAWRVLNHFIMMDWPDDERGHTTQGTALEAILENMEIMRRSPAEAQTAWLDKILELAIEAGLVEVVHE